MVPVNASLNVVNGIITHIGEENKCQAGCHQRLFFAEGADLFLLIRREQSIKKLSDRHSHGVMKLKDILLFSSANGMFFRFAPGIDARAGNR